MNKTANAATKDAIPDMSEIKDLISWVSYLYFSHEVKFRCPLQQIQLAWIRNENQAETSVKRAFQPIEVLKCLGEFAFCISPIFCGNQVTVNNSPMGLMDTMLCFGSFSLYSIFVISQFLGTWHCHILRSLSLQLSTPFMLNCIIN